MPREDDYIPVPGRPTLSDDVQRTMDEQRRGKGSADPLDKLEALQRSAEARELVDSIAAMVRDAANASPVIAKTAPGFQDPVAMLPADTSRRTQFSLRGASLVGLFDDDGRIRRAPAAEPSSEETSISAAVLSNSRIARAGARVVIMPEAVRVVGTGRIGAVGFEELPVIFRGIDAAPFSEINVNTAQDVGESPLPIHESRVQLGEMKAKAVRFTLTRKDRRDIGGEEKLVGLVLASIALGLARAADATLFDALAAESLAPYSLGAAAAQDLEFACMRSIIGTAATGAAVGGDGVLRAAGVAGELTADTAATYVGDWARAAVFVRDDITVYAERLGTNGDSTIICWAAMQAAIPTPAQFCEVVA